MMARPLVLIVAAFSALLAQAAPPTPVAPPVDLASAIERETVAREALKVQAGESQAVLQKWYHSALDAVKKDAAAKADLDGVVAVDQERQRVERDLTPEEKAALPKLLASVRTQFDQGRAQRATAQKTALAASLREYLGTLENLEKSLTRKLEVENALAVRKERAAAAEELNALTAATAPAPVASVRATPAAIATSPAPGANATPPPRVTSLSSGSLGNVPVVQVASELKAHGTIQSPHKNAIAFEAPPSTFDHVQGGRGVLLKSETGSTKKGSTWTVSWTWANGINGISFVHPYGGGHMLVRLRQTGLQPVVYRSWQDGPWSAGGSPQIFKETEAVAELFPLKMNQKYLVVSQVGPKGNYTMSIDGKVVFTGAFRNPGEIAVYTTATPLTLPAGFKGENLPMKWKAGDAALLVGPVAETGFNLCENITYQASAPEK